MPTVEIPEVGTVEFPDDMTHEQIVSAIENDIIPSRKPTLRPSIPEPGRQAMMASVGVPDRPTQAFATEDVQQQAIGRLPEISAAEAERIVTTPFVSLPRAGEEGTVLRAVSNVGEGLIEQALLTPASGLLGLATAVPGARAVAGTLLSAAAAKDAATKLGEASVTGNKQTMTEGALEASLALLGGIASGRQIATESPVTSVRAIAQENATPKPITPASEAPTVPLTEQPTPPAEGQVAVLPSASERPLGIVSPITPGIANLSDFITGKIEAGKLFLRGAAGEALPKMTEANRDAAEAGVSYASARVAAPYKAEVFVDKALEGTGVDPVKLGAALTEDNLRGVYDQRVAAGEDPATVNVHTVIGKRGSPFATEADYQAFLEDPATKQAIEQYKQLWTEIKDPQFRLAQGIDPSVPLPTRGRQTGARVNLFPIQEGEPVPSNIPVSGAGGAGNLLATLKRKSPFGRQATGTGDQYVIDLRDMMANSFNREFAIAMKNKMDNLLIEKGDALVQKVGEAPPMIKGEKAVSFPYQQRSFVTPEGDVIPASKSLWIRKSIAPEYRRLAGTDAPAEIPLVTKTIGERLTKASLAGLSEGTIHVSNLLTGLFTRPGPTSNLLINSLLKGAGRADIPVTFVQVITKAFQNNKAQLAELAEIGALKEPFSSGPMGKILNHVDKAVRLTLDDIYKGFAEKGLVEDTPTARREFISQVGQYNKRLQGPLIKMLRETQVGPFATAGRAFNALGIRTAVLSPGVKATSAAKAAAFRAEALAGWVGMAAIAATWNYLKTGTVTGGVNTKLGNLYLDDKHEFPLSDLLGYGRALRVVGARGVIESKRVGLSNANAVESGAEQAITSFVNPALGPLTRSAITAVSGKRAALPIVQEVPLEPPGSNVPQIVRNIEHVLLQANPIVGTIYEANQGKPLEDVIQRQLTRFAPRTTADKSLLEALPRIVEKRQMEDYLDNISQRARKLTPEAANKLFDEARDAIEKIDDPRLRKEGVRILRGKQKFVR